MEFYNGIKNDNIRFRNDIQGDVIEIRGQIGEGSLFSKGYTATDFKNDLEKLGDKPVIIEISSGGGNVFDAFEIGDKIKNISSKVTTKIVGTSASAATLIAMSGDLRQITENSRYHIHRASVGVSGNSGDLRAIITELDDIDQQILAIYSEKSTKTPEEIYNLMLEDRSISAQDALEWGFVDEIINSKKNNSNMKNNKKEIVNKQEEKEVMTPEAKVEKEEFKAEETLQEQEEDKTEEPEAEEKMTEEEMTNLITALKEELEEAKNALKEKEVEAAEKEAEEIENFITDSVNSGVITNDVREHWFDIASDKGIEKAKALMNSIKPVKKTIKGEVIEKTPIRNKSKEELFNDWKTGKIDGMTYKNMISTLK